MTPRFILALALMAASALSAAGAAAASGAVRCDVRDDRKYASEMRGFGLWFDLSGASCRGGRFTPTAQNGKSIYVQVDHAGAPHFANLMYRASTVHVLFRTTSARRGTVPASENERVSEAVLIDRRRDGGGREVARYRIEAALFEIPFRFEIESRVRADGQVDVLSASYERIAYTPPAPVGRLEPGMTMLELRQAVLGHAPSSIADYHAIVYYAETHLRREDWTPGLAACHPDAARYFETCGYLAKVMRNRAALQCLAQAEAAAAAAKRRDKNRTPSAEDVGWAILEAYILGVANLTGAPLSQNGSRCGRVEPVGLTP